MIHDSNRYAVGTCPECGKISRTKISAFSFSGKKNLRFVCDEKYCSSDIFEIRQTKNGYRITVECPACDEVHTYTMSKANFWNKPYFSFNCPTWCVNILYFGTDDKFIEKQINSQDDNIYDIFGSFVETDTDADTMYALVEAVNVLAKKDCIKCGCEETSGNITIGIVDDVVLLSCKKCNRTKRISATDENIDTILKTGTIVLDNTNL